MKKINFSDKFGLTEAVLSGRKTQTRRIILNCSGIRLSPFCTSGIEDNHGYELKPKFAVGEVVAVAQSYKDAGYDPDMLQTATINGNIGDYPISQLPGWNNKMFTYPPMMPHQIRITDVRVERLQDISYEDCIAEGVCKWTKDRELFKYDMADGFEMFEWKDKPRTPREAYAALIDRISGKGTFESNPYVFVYEFELIK